MEIPTTSHFASSFSKDRYHCGYYVLALEIDRSDSALPGLPASSTQSTPCHIKLAELLSSESGLPPEVARLQLSRTDFSNAQPGAEQIAALKAAAPILLSEGLVRKGVDVNQVVDQLIDPQFATAVIGKN